MNLIIYFFLVLSVIPFVPYLFLKGKSIRRDIPKLEAPTDITGQTDQTEASFKLLTIGESTIAGIGVNSHYDGFTGHLAQCLKESIQQSVQWEVFAKSGLTAAGIYQKVVSEPISTTPNLIVIGTGANDAFRLKSPATFIKYTKQTILHLQTQFPDCPIVFTSMPPIRLFPAFPAILKFFVGQMVDLYQKELFQWTQSMPGVYFDNHPIGLKDWGFEQRPVSDFFSDGVHPSSITYRRWAEMTNTYIASKNMINDD